MVRCLLRPTFHYHDEPHFCPSIPFPAHTPYKHTRLQQTKMTRVQIHEAACRKCQQMSEKNMAPQQEYEDMPSVQHIPRLCDDARKDERPSELLAEMKHNDKTLTRDPEAPTACRCDSSSCRCDSSTRSGVHHKTSAFRPGQIKELQRHLRISYAVNVAFFILIFVANYFFRVPFERPILSDRQHRVAGLLAGLRTILGMAIGWLMGERLQSLVDGVYEIAVKEKTKHERETAEEKGVRRRSTTAEPSSSQVCRGHRSACTVATRIMRLTMSRLWAIRLEGAQERRAPQAVAIVAAVSSTDMMR